MHVVTVGLISRDRNFFKKMQVLPTKSRFSDNNRLFSKTKPEIKNPLRIGKQNDLSYRKIYGFGGLFFKFKKLCGKYEKKLKMKFT